MGEKTTQQAPPFHTIPQSQWIPLTRTKKQAQHRVDVTSYIPTPRSLRTQPLTVLLRSHMASKPAAITSLKSSSPGGCIQQAQGSSIFGDGPLSGFPARHVATLQEHDLASGWGGDGMGVVTWPTDHPPDQGTSPLGPTTCWKS